MKVSSMKERASSRSRAAGSRDGRGGSGSGPVIHSAARGGPECLAGLEGSIKWAAVSRLVSGERPLTTTSSLELPLFTVGRGGDGIDAVGHRVTAVVLIVRAFARGARQRISPSRRP